MRCVSKTWIPQATTKSKPKISVVYSILTPTLPPEVPVILIRREPPLHELYKVWLVHVNSTLKHCTKICKRNAIKDRQMTELLDPPPSKSFRPGHKSLGIRR